MKIEKSLKQNENIFNRLQKRNIWIGAVLVGTLTLLVFFPLTSLILYFMQRNFPNMENSVQTLSANFFGNVQATDLNLYDRNFLIRVKNLDMDVDILQALWGKMHTSGMIQNGHFDTRFIGLEMDNLSWDINFSNAWSSADDAPNYADSSVLSYRTGIAKLEANQVTLLQVGKGLNTYITSDLIDALNIDKIEIRVEAQNENYAIRMSQISSNLLSLTFDGYVDRFITFQNATVCLKAQPDLQLQFPQLYAIFILQKSTDKPLCYRIQGSIDSLKFTPIQ